jgi:chromate transporter
MVEIREVLREWGRIGIAGFGGPPVHIAMLRELCVERRGWIAAREFEDANAACGLLPGPASTQMAIFCAQRVAGVRGALVGGLAFILPGLVLLIALAAISLSDRPPTWIRGAGAAAGAAVLAVVLQAGIALARTSLADHRGARLARALAYVAIGAAAAALAGAGVVLALLACGLLELVVRREGRPTHPRDALASVAAPGLVALVTLGAAALPALAWTALKVGALSYGGGYVIVPIMQADAVDAYHWMTDAQFLNAVALGQLTPGPVVQTVAAVGYAAAGLGGAILASVVAFAPSFVLVWAVLGGGRFERLRGNLNVRAFLDGAGPAAVGAILGTLVPLAGGLHEPWQAAVAVAAAVALFAARRGAALRRPTGRGPAVESAAWIPISPACCSPTTPPRADGHPCPRSAARRRSAPSPTACGRARWRRSSARSG